jgi:RNA polymerase sigma-70 factor (ECF subfamily)
MSVPDDELITRVLRHDDRDAFGELVRKHQSPLRAMLRKLTCGDQALADDLAQETFVRAFLKLSAFRGKARFSTWLYRIAYNLFLGEKRRLSGRISRLQSRPDPFTGPSSGNPAGLQIDLENAMIHLTKAERAAVVFCCAKGFSHQETARILDCPVGTVKTHVLRGKQKLRSLLAAWERTV